MAAGPLSVERMRVIPECREATGSLGSATLEVSGGCPEVLGPIVEQLARRFRKAWFDLASGIAVFMAPSGMHEVTARGILDLVRALGECRGLAVVPMGATTARTPDGSSAADPDESCFVGRRAERFLDVMRSGGRAAAIAEVESEPRDLVIEVEHSRRDAAKPGIYRKAGVTELWELATGSARRAPRIWDLQGQPAPVSTQASRVFPGVRALALPAAMTELERMGGLIGLARGMERGDALAEQLMAAAGVTSVADRERPPPRGPGPRR